MVHIGTIFRFFFEFFIALNKKNNKKLLENLKKCEDEAATLAGRIADLESVVLGLKSEKADLSDQNEHQAHTLFTVKAELTESMELLAKLKAEKEKMQDFLAGSTEEIRSRDSKIFDLSNNLRKLEAEVNLMERKLNVQIRQNEGQKAYTEQLQARLDDTNARNLQLQSEQEEILEDLHTMIDQKDKEIEALNNEMKKCEGLVIQRP